MFSLSVSFTILLDKTEDFVDMAVKHTREMMEEERTYLRCELYRSQDEPEKFSLQVVYKDQQDARKDWPVLDSFHKAVKPWLLKSRIISWDRLI